MKTEMNRYMSRSEIIDRLCDYNDGDTKYTPYLPYKRNRYVDPAVQKLIDDHEASLPEWMRYEW